MVVVNHWQHKLSDKANLISTQWFFCLLLDIFLLFKAYQVPIKPILFLRKRKLHTTRWHETIGGGGNWNKALIFSDLDDAYCTEGGGGCVGLRVGRKRSPPRGSKPKPFIVMYTIAKFTAVTCRPIRNLFVFFNFPSNTNSLTSTHHVHTPRPLTMSTHHIHSPHPLTKSTHHVHSPHPRVHIENALSVKFYLLCCES